MTYQIISERRLRNVGQVINPNNLFRMLRRYADSKQEQFIVITLDGKHAPIRIIIVTIGIVNRTIIHPREVFYHAIKDMAVSIIVSHNHPSNIVVPSEEDLAITELLMESGRIIGIPVIDHIIINKNTYFSFRMEGLINEKNEFEYPDPAVKAIWRNKYKG
jgi:DNA repair protein RadC